MADAQPHPDLCVIVPESDLDAQESSAPRAPRTFGNRARVATGLVVVAILVIVLVFVASHSSSHQDASTTNTGPTMDQIVIAYNAMGRDFNNVYRDWQNGEYSLAESEASDATLNYSADDYSVVDRATGLFAAGYAYESEWNAFMGAVKQERDETTINEFANEVLTKGQAFAQAAHLTSTGKPAT